MLLAVVWIALATALGWALGLVWPDIFEFLTFYPAVLVTGLARGPEAGVAAIAQLTQNQRIGAFPVRRLISRRASRQSRRNVPISRSA